MLLVDNNLSPRILLGLKTFFPYSVHVAEVGLESASDISVWNYAKANSLSILTKDSDFFHLLNLRGHPPKLIWLKTGNASTSHLRRLMEENLNPITEFLSQEKSGLLEIY